MEERKPQVAWNETRRGMAADRAESQMTLGDLTMELEKLPPEANVTGFGNPWSYRGHYEDLAFGISEEAETAATLRRRCLDCMGQIFQGWKGVDYPMDANTAVWLTTAPRDLGERLMSLDIESDPIRPVTEPEEDLSCTANRGKNR